MFQEQLLGLGRCGEQLEETWDLGVMEGEWVGGGRRGGWERDADVVRLFISFDFRNWGGGKQSRESRECCSASALVLQVPNGANRDIRASN